MAHDPELKAMADIYEAIKDLDVDAKHRVINWLLSKCSLDQLKTPDPTPVIEEVGAAPVSKLEIDSFDSVADIFAKISPSKDRDKALVVAAFLQQKNNYSEVTGAEINKELRHLGHGLKNVTDAISQMIRKKPSLMIQTRKEGKSVQARKKYKVTTEGVMVVNKMLLPLDE